MIFSVFKNNKYIAYIKKQKKTGWNQRRVSSDRHLFSTGRRLRSH